MSGPGRLRRCARLGRTAMAAMAPLLPFLGGSCDVSPSSTDAGGNEPPEKAWQRFECRAGGFAVEFPGKPSRYPTKSPDDPVKYLVVRGSTVYMVAYADMGRDGATAQEVFDKVEADVFGPPNRIVQRGEARLKDGTIGRALTAEDQDGDITLWRGYVVRPRMYQTVVITSPSKRNARDVARFHESFRLLRPTRSPSPKESGAAP